MIHGGKDQQMSWVNDLASVAEIPASAATLAM
jgi:hypothetical protein